MNKATVCGLMRWQYSEQVDTQADAINYFVAKQPMIRSKSKLEAGILFKVSRMKEVIKPTRPHKHDGYYEFVLLSQGAGFHTIDDVVYDVEPPLLHVLKPGQVHCWNFSQIPQGYVLMVREDFFTNFHGLREKLYELPVEIKLPEPAPYLSLYEQCYGEYLQHPHHLDTLEAYLNLIIVKLHHQASHAQPLMDPPARQTLYQFKKLIDQKFAEYKQVNQYASLLHLSAAKLNQLCKDSVGKSAQAIIKERVVIEAKNLLYHTDQTVVEISHQLQFSDASNFVKFFKAHTNLTPQQYRKMR